MVVGVLMLAGGIAVGAQRPVSSGDGPLFLWVALAATAVGLYLALGRRPVAGREARSAAAPLSLLVLAGALLGTVTRTAADRSCSTLLPPGMPVTLWGRVADRRADRLELQATAVELGSRGSDRSGERLPCVGEVAARYEGPLPGGRTVVVEGRWWRPPGTSGAGLRPVGLLMVDTIRGPGAGEGDRGGSEPAAWGGVASRLRSVARSRVDTLFDDRAPLAASLLLAQRDGLDRDTRDRFAQAGLSHLLAISGLHVALVAGLLLLLAGALRLGKTAGSGAAGAGTLGYVLFLGAPHSAARAALQILMVLGARAAQRPARTEALMATAALVLLAMDPAGLFQPGFQLSFAGVAGILALRPPLLDGMARLARVKVGGVTAGRWLADGLATSVAATLATAPVVAWHFGRVAPIGVVANLVAIPLLSVTVPALALAMAVGALWGQAGAFLAGAGKLLLDGLDATAALAASVPGTVAVPGSVALVLTAGLGVGWAVSRRLGRVRGRIRAVGWGGVTVAVLMVAPLRPVSDHVEIHVIDVGQGDAIAIRSPAGRWLLVDAGVARGGYDAGARLVVPYLSRHGATRLEGLILTHPDADHVGGAGAVMVALRPRWTADPGMTAPKEDYLALLREAAGEGVPWVAARRGMELELDGVRLQVLSPAGRVASADANDASVVVRLVYGEFQALLTGDAPVEVERALVRRYGRGLEADVLKVGHHGSRTSTSPELLAATGASVALISAGRGNRYGHPNQVVLDRLDSAGLTVVRTDRDGSIVVRGTREGRVTVSTVR